MRTAVSRKSIEAHYQRLEVEAKDRANPDSPYWHGQFDLVRQDLTDLIGKEGYEQWAELVWPGETIDGLTWKQIYQQIDRALDEAWQGKRDLNILADAALYPEQNVPGCYGL
jgi:hypothetical protein